MTTPVPAKKTITSYKNQKLASDIERIHQALVVEAIVNKIPENTFKRDILPIITGEVISAEFPLLMAAVAGNPFSEVDIVDEEGNTLFRMPALLDRNVISHEEASKRGSMQSMLITAEMLTRQSPHRAEKYLEHEFNGRGIARNHAEITAARNQRWNEILARYGKSLDGTDTAKVISGKSTNKEKPQLDFTDEDLL